MLGEDLTVQLNLNLVIHIQKFEYYPFILSSYTRTCGVPLLKLGLVEIKDQICICTDRETNDLIELTDDQSVALRADEVKLCFLNETEGPQVLFDGRKGPDAQFLSFRWEEK
jgi:hypothetical protein